MPNSKPQCVALPIGALPCSDYAATRGKNTGLEFHRLKLPQLRDIRWNHRRHRPHRRCRKFAGKLHPLHPATAEATYQPLGF